MKSFQDIFWGTRIKLHAQFNRWSNTSQHNGNFCILCFPERWTVLFVISTVWPYDYSLLAPPPPLPSPHPASRAPWAVRPRAPTVTIPLILPLLRSEISSQIPPCAERESFAHSISDFCENISLLENPFWKSKQLPAPLLCGTKWIALVSIEHRGSILTC